MLTRASTLVRVLRTLTAAITIWCTGCSGFEPLLSAMLGGENAPMACAAGSGATMPGMASPADKNSQDTGFIGAPAEHEQGFDCTCGSCHAVAVSYWTVAEQIAPLPQSAHADLPSLVSADPTALRPPPNRLA
ncbi:MAG: hypothetical protein ABI969_19860 [bacterium]